MGKSKQGRVTPKKQEERATPPPSSDGVPISVNPEKVIAFYRQKAEAAEHRATLLELAYSDIMDELQALRVAFDEISAAATAGVEVADKKAKKEKKANAQG